MDVTIMQEALSESFEITRITDGDATREQIAAAFAALAERAGPDDAVLVHYSGHSVPDGMYEGTALQDTYLIAHDTVDGASGVSAEQLHAWLQAIPSRHTTIVLDTHPQRAFMELAEKGDYRMLIASDSAQLAYERQVEFGGRIVSAGSFTVALAAQLWESDSETLTFGELLDGCIRRLEDVDARPSPVSSDTTGPWPEFTPQVPVLVGDRDDLVFGVSDVHLWAFDFAVRRTYPRASVQRLRTRRRHLPSDLAQSFAALEVSFARAFLEHDGFDEAIDALDSVAAQAGSHVAEVQRLLAVAHLRAHRLADARPSLESLAALVEPAETRATLTSQASALGRSRRFALMVGIDRYRNEEQRPEARPTTHGSSGRRSSIAADSPTRTSPCSSTRRRRGPRSSTRSGSSQTSVARIPPCSSSPGTARRLLRIRRS